MKKLWSCLVMLLLMSCGGATGDEQRFNSNTPRPAVEGGEDQCTYDSQIATVKFLYASPNTEGTDALLNGNFRVHFETLVGDERKQESGLFSRACSEKFKKLSVTSGLVKLIKWGPCQPRIVTIDGLGDACAEIG